MKATLSMAVAIAAIVAVAWLASTLADVLGGIIVLAAMPLFTRSIMDLAAEPGEEPQRLGRPRFSHVPIRARLTIVFVAIMATVLAAAGVFVYAQFHSTLDAQISDALRLEAADVGALVARGHSSAIAQSSNPLAVGCRAGGCLARVYRADGRLLASTPQSGALRLLTVADSLALRDNELARLRTLLLITGPLALLLASVGGYELARAALRPIERMRLRAERITERQLSERLPVSEAADEIAALGRTLNAMLDRVEAAVARERRVVSDASHELRTPLTTLRAEVDLALMGDRDKAELRAALESASEEARRMSRLADDLLVLARADQGRLPLHPRRR